MLSTKLTRTAAVMALATALTACSSDDPTVELDDAAAETTVDDTATEPADSELSSDADHEDGDEAASVEWGNVADGDTVEPTFTYEFVAHGVTVSPAGEVVEGEGHFHVIVDAGCVEAGEVVPNDETHLHFGDGSTEAEITLEPGEHTLCLQFADGEHVATGLTAEITVTVA